MHLPLHTDNWCAAGPVGQLVTRGGSDGAGQAEAVLLPRLRHGQAARRYHRLGCGETEGFSRAGLGGPDGVLGGGYLFLEQGVTLHLSAERG